MNSLLTWRERQGKAWRGSTERPRAPISSMRRYFVWTSPQLTRSDPVRDYV